MTQAQPDPDSWDLEVLAQLQERDGVETTVVLQNGQRLAVLDIGWGYDMGDVFSHITTNCSPGEKGWPLHFFYTDDVHSIVDPTSGATLLERRPQP